MADHLLGHLSGLYSSCLFSIGSVEALHLGKVCSYANAIYCQVGKNIFNAKFVYFLVVELYSEKPKGFTQTFNDFVHALRFYMLCYMTCCKAPISWLS